MSKVQAMFDIVDENVISDSINSNFDDLDVEVEVNEKKTEEVTTKDPGEDSDVDVVMNEKETEEVNEKKTEEVMEEDPWKNSEVVSVVNEKKPEEPTTEDSEDVRTIDENSKILEEFTANEVIVFIADEMSEHIQFQNN